MSYIDKYGKTIGPIKIGHIWLLNHTEPAIQDVRDAQSYLCFSANNQQPRNCFIPLMARTPIIGTYYDENNKLTASAPPNAVATVEWVVAYSNLAPGQKPGFDIDSFAKLDDLKKLQDRIDKLDTTTIELWDAINANSERIEVNTENITNLKNRMVTAESQISQVTQQVQSMLEEPFPDGFILLCGEVYDE